MDCHPPLPFKDECPYTVIQDFNELEEHLQDSINCYLEERVGEAFLKELNFESCYIRCYKDASLKEKQYAEAGLELAKYSVFFSWQNFTQGVEFYCVEFAMDKHGNLIYNGINLPDFKNKPEKMKVIPLAEAEQIARSLKYKKPRGNLRLTHNRETLIWTFRHFKTNKYIRTLEIDANTGAVITNVKGPYLNFL